jgi:hypothetical protein
MPRRRRRRRSPAPARSAHGTQAHGADILENDLPGSKPPGMVARRRRSCRGAGEGARIAVLRDPSISAADSRALTRTGHAPIRDSAKTSTASDTEFSLMTTTRSPGRMPCARKSSAAASTAVSRPAPVSATLASSTTTAPARCAEPARDGVEPAGRLGHPSEASRIMARAMTSCWIWLVPS